MSGPEFVIPFHQLPERFADRIEDPPENPSTPRPAATIVLVRDGEAGVEVLLMRRNRKAGFVPGAYVFPGGRVDGTDATPETLKRVDGLGAEHASLRLELQPHADPPAIAYYLAALREAFEETGILVGTRPDGTPVPTAESDADVDRIRDDVMEDRLDFGGALSELDCRIDGASVEYLAHWITPEPEPRRYDTRFFAAKVTGEATPIIDPREMTDGVWTTPVAALERCDAGHLPMVFPTIKTLEQLSGYTSADELMADVAGMEIKTIMPTLVITPTGVGMELDDDE